MTAMLIGSAANLIFDSTPAADLRAYRERVEARLGKGAPGDFGPNPLEEAEIWFNLTLLDVMDQNISAGC